MTDQNRTGAANQLHKKNRSQVKKAAVVAKQTGAQAGLAQLPAEPVGLEATGYDPILTALLSGPQGAFGGGSQENQADQLSDPRLSTVQRQALAVEIGRVQGNRYLQRVVAPLSRKRQGSGSSCPACVEEEDLPGQRRPAITPIQAQTEPGVCPICGQRGRDTCPGCGQKFKPQDRADGDEAIVQTRAATGPGSASTELAENDQHAQEPDMSGLEASRVAAEQLPADKAATEPERLSSEATAKISGLGDVPATVADTSPTPDTVTAEAAPPAATPTGEASLSTEGAASLAEDRSSAQLGQATEGVAEAVPSTTLEPAAASTEAASQAKGQQVADMAQQNLVKGQKNPRTAGLIGSVDMAASATPGQATGVTEPESQAEAATRIQQETEAETAGLVAERPPTNTSGFQAILSMVPGAENQNIDELATFSSQGSHPGTAGQPAASPNELDSQPGPPASQFDVGCQNEPKAYVAPPVDVEGLKEAKQAELDAEYERQVAETRTTAASQLERGQQIAAQKRTIAHQEKAQKEAEARAQAGQRQQQARAAAAQQQAEAQVEAASRQSQAQQQAATQQQSFLGTIRAGITSLRSRGQQLVQQVTGRVRSGAQQLITRAQQAARSVLERGRRAAERARREVDRMRQGARNLLGRALDAIRSGVRRLITTARNLWNRAVNAARRLINQARRAVDRLRAWGQRMLQRAARWLRENITRAWRWLRQKVKALMRWLRRTIVRIINWLRNVLRAILRFLQSVIAWIIMALGWMLMVLAERLLRALITIAGWLGEWGQGIQRWLRDKLSDLQGLRARVGTFLKDAFTGDLYGCNDVQKAKIKTASALAITLGNTALSKLTTPSTMDAATKAEFVRFFKSDAEAHINRARAVLGAAVAGIDANPTDLRCEPASSTQCGGVHAYTFWAILVPFVSMHFCADFLKRSDREVALVILHEATHKFAQTYDHAYGSGALSLSTDQALSNADSYEQFVGAVA